MSREDRLITYGGQALIEGVLMRGQKALAIAVRAPNGEIVVRQEALGSLYRSRLTRLPFLRGMILLWDALVLGLRALTSSANIQVGEDEKLEGPALYGTLILSLTIAIGLFFLLPAAIASGIEHWMGLGWWIKALIEGGLRLGLVIGYIWALGFMPDVRRLFAYHGAEHKTINAYEAGAELTPESVARFPLEHPRCGTSFLLTLVVLTVLAFPFLDGLPIWARLFGRILLIPFLAGIAVEYIRWMANHLDRRWARWLIRPNLALQRLTTREPDAAMLEVAIRAFSEMQQAEASPAHGNGR